jgi:hypothetical protein
MMLQSRVSRLEQKHTSGNPLDALTDEELEAAIRAVDASIEAATGMSAAAYAEKLEQDAEGGKPSALDAASVHAFIVAMKKDFRLAYDQLRQGAT